MVRERESGGNLIFLVSTYTAQVQEWVRGAGMEILSPTGQPRARNDSEGAGEEGRPSPLSPFEEKGLTRACGCRQGDVVSDLQGLMYGAGWSSRNSGGNSTPGQ